MKSFILIIILFCSPFNLKSQEKVFAVKTLSNFYMNPQIDAPIIYPVEQGKEMTVKKVNESWYNVLDGRTGLMGWILKEHFSSTKPKEILQKKDYENSFNIFKERVLEMSSSIKEAIKINTFLNVSHMGGAAAFVIAHDDWFKGRRHANQAFQVYEIWKGLNQSPSFLSFRNENNEEQFIVLSGPHRPRYLKSN